MSLNFQNRECLALDSSFSSGMENPGFYCEILYLFQNYCLSEALSRTLVSFLLCCCCCCCLFLLFLLGGGVINNCASNLLTFISFVSLVRWRAASWIFMLILPRFTFRKLLRVNKEYKQHDWQDVFDVMLTAVIHHLFERNTNAPLPINEVNNVAVSCSSCR